jgi:hypothetical protein
MTSLSRLVALALALTVCACAPTVTHWTGTVSLYVVDETEEQLLLEATLHAIGQWQPHFPHAIVVVSEPVEGSVRVHWLADGPCAERDTLYGRATVGMGEDSQLFVCEQVPPSRLKTTMNHELGHVLGIEGHTDDHTEVEAGGSAMVSYMKKVTDTLTDLDVAALRDALGGRSAAQLDSREDCAFSGRR